jgi:hypothetical protein
MAQIIISRILMIIVPIVGLVLISLKENSLKNSKINHLEELSIMFTVIMFGVLIFQLSYGLATMYFNTQDPTTDQINPFINAIIGSAVSILAISQLSDRSKQNQ